MTQNANAHTPGPWQALIDWPTAVFPGHLIKEVDGVQRSVALIPRGGNNQSVQDAALIAAAPELLAALKALVEKGGIGPEAMFDDARDAIAKAEGRA